MPTPSLNPEEENYRFTSNNIYLRSTFGRGLNVTDNSNIPQGVSPATLDTKSMARATQKLLARERSGHHPRPTAGEREREYISIIRHNGLRIKSAYELLHSEQPVYLGYLKYEIIRELYKFASDAKNKDGTVSFTCAKTKLAIPHEYAFMCMGRIYAADQLPTVEMCASCQNVTTDCMSVTDYLSKPMFLCNHCSNKRIHCQRCSSPLAMEYYSVRLCTNCMEMPFGDRPTRSYCRGTKWCGDKLGLIMHSPRVFSFEIEGTVKNSKTLETIGDTLPPEAGIGGDSSIRGGLGIEIQSPKLQGSRGEEFVARVGSAVKHAKMTVNESCGMHVHLDGEGLLPQSRQQYPRALIELWKTHLVFEDIIFSLLPFNRRLNQFCRPMRDYFKVSELEAVETIFDAEKLWYKQQDSNAIHSEKQHHHHASRYFGVNMHSLFAEGNLELRHHSGTLNGKKILHWANLHALIIDAAVQGKFTFEFLAEAQATTSIREKTKMLFEAIGLSGASQSYFLGRQAKFSDKGVVEDGLTPIPIVSVLPRRNRIISFPAEVSRLRDNDLEL